MKHRCINCRKRKKLNQFYLCSECIEKIIKIDNSFKHFLNRCYGNFNDNDNLQKFFYNGKYEFNNQNNKTFNEYYQKILNIKKYDFDYVFNQIQNTMFNFFDKFSIYFKNNKLYDMKLYPFHKKNIKFMSIALASLKIRKEILNSKKPYYVDSDSIVSVDRKFKKGVG